ncbi:MAG: hypothetical protein ACYC9O_16135 [Candidatus Latescibacterota bacterium]
MLTLFAGCRDARFQSVWRDGEISVDALYHDWTGALTYLDEPSMFIGFRNDEENVYILVKTVDSRSQMKVMRLGLTVHIEPADHPEKTWGVRFPVGLKNHGIPLHGAAGPGNPTPEERASMHEMLGRLELLGPEAGRRVETAPQQPVGTDYGIRAAIRDTSEVIVYELKFPLRGSEQQPYAAWTGPGGKIRLRFETGDIRVWEDEKDPLQYDPNRDTSTGKLRDRGRDREQDREDRRRMPPMMNPLAEPIQFQVEIILAKIPGGIPDKRK